MRVLRGETVAATLGLMLGAVLLVVLAASSFWTLYTARDSMEAARRDRIRATAALLAQAAEGQLASGEITALRRLVADAARSDDLEECRVILPGGGVLADADSSRVTLPKFSGTWPDGTLEPAATTDEAGSLRIVAELSVPGKGPARLIIAGPVRPEIWSTWQVRAGLGSIAVVGLSGLLFTYRLMRTRLKALTAVGEALVAADTGERSVEVLRVESSFGPAAKAWNALLDERETLRHEVEAANALVKSGTGGSGVDRDLQNACDALWLGLVMIDASMRITYANGAAGVLLGKKREELVGASLADFSGSGGGVEIIKGVASGTLRKREVFEIKTSDNGVLRFGCRAVRREDASTAVVIIEDVTQQKASDEARNSLVSQATHELRTPLTNIRLYVEALLDQQEDDPEARAKCVNVISQEARRLERIVGDMLSVAEIEAGTLTIKNAEVRLEPLFDELRADFDAQAQDKEIQLKFELPPKWPTLVGDRDKLTLALHNLVGNALKYTPAGGRVTVKVDIRAEAGKGDMLIVDVQDNGIGIKPDEHELIFERFYRAKDNRIGSITGSGLGLALARQIARQHGGDITISSEIDKGSTFTLTVPMGHSTSAANAVVRKAA